MGDKGNDTLLGGDGLDNLWGEAGSNIFSFQGETVFSHIDCIRDFVSSDKIDITDILLDYRYNQNIYNVSDWAIILVSGVDSYIGIDRDGAGSTHTSFTNIVLVDNTISLTVADFIIV